MMQSSPSSECRSQQPGLLLVGLAVLALMGNLPAWVWAASDTPAELKHLKYRCIGPWAGGRVCRVAGVPGDPRIYYVASAAGGVWKSVDAGATWKPITDEQTVSSIGSIAIASSNPN